MATKQILAMIMGGSALVAGAASVSPQREGTVVETAAYSWRGDTLRQDTFKAWAVSPEEIRSTYHGRPGYFMPVGQTWRRRNDLSSYPRLSDPNGLLQAVYNMGLDEMVNAVEPDTTLRTGKEWAGVWTRDVSYSIILSMAALQPEASMISLMKKVNPQGQIIQDTGSGGAWPVSTDRMIWVLAAWEIYKTTGSSDWLKRVYPIAVRSLEKDAKTIMSPEGLVKGETSFIDWREQSYPRWMQTVDISQSEAMGTNVLYAAAMKAVADMAETLGKKREAKDWSERSQELAKAIDGKFWMPEKGYYGMYTYGRDGKMLNPRAETLGEALSILYDIAPADRQKSISENNPVTPFGPAIFYPQIADMPNYHNNALWPFVASYWTLAQAKAGNEAGVLEGIGSVVRPAALFATNKENFNLDNGDYYTELNSSNMLWSLAGNLSLVNRILFGLHFEKEGLLVRPFVPKSMGGVRRLENFPYRGGRLDITVEGYGSKVASLTLNGKPLPVDAVISAGKLKGDCRIVVKMDNAPIPGMALNRVANAKAPLTPAAWISEGASGAELQWNPIEYIAGYVVYKDGKEVGRTRQTSWPLVGRGEWQVAGIDGSGTLSFASEPRSNRQTLRFQMDGERTAAVSKEISYAPATPIAGYHGEGFAETSHEVPAVNGTVSVVEPGLYAVTFRYANGNGPVNTENKCAVRSLYVNDEEVATVVMPQRGVGNWDDWGLTNTVRVLLPAGQNVLGLVLNSEDENMNLATNHALIDEIILEKVE